MKNNLIMKLLTLLIFLTATLAGCAAWGDRLSEEGRVLQADDKPCFTVADNEETRVKLLELSTIDVSEVVSVGTNIRWEISSKNHGNIISPTECITYGATPAHMKTETQPIALEVGKPYEMGIGSYVLKTPPNKWSRREYRANFCLTQDESTKKITVHQVYYDDNLGKLRWDKCGIHISQ